MFNFVFVSMSGFQYATDCILQSAGATRFDAFVTPRHTEERVVVNDTELYKQVYIH